MKFTTILASVATATLFLFDRSIASPINLSPRDTPSNKVIIGYFPNWIYQEYLPKNIDFKKYTHIYYAFAIENSDAVPVWEDKEILSDDVDYGFPALVKAAKTAGTKVTISIGGWTGSQKFSTMVSSSSSRSKFIQWNVDFIKKYNTAGVDIDWEYPNDVGAGSNAHNPNDVRNLLELVKELRSTLDNNFKDDYKEITMAVHITPWGGEKDVNDVSPFVPYIDRFQVMAYDVNGAWDTTSGPNAPFRVEKGKGYQKGFVEGIESWKDAGVPFNKIAGGIPFYGKAQTLTVSEIPETQYNPGVSPNPPHGDSDDSDGSGAWKWKNLRSQKVLTTPTTAASPWVRHFDNITQTPWLYNPTNKQYISYDDPVSVGVKTQWAIDNGLAGVFCWSVEQDNGELLAVMQPMIDKNSPSAGTITTYPSNTITGLISTAKILVKATDKSDTGCSGVATYNSSTAYNSGDKVIYNGKLYTANYWVQNQTPNPNGSKWDTWKHVGPC